MRPRLLAIALVVFVLGSIALEACDDLRAAFVRRYPASLRILLAWVLASILLVLAMHAAYARGRRDGIDIGAVRMLYHLRPTRAALSDSLMHHHAHAALDARRIHAYLSGVKL
jgi:hypothetical protein